jgi:chemotaxis family two-component system sensor kinase Cph1
MPLPAMCAETSVGEMQRFLDHAVHDLRAVLRKIGTSIEILGEGHLQDAPYPAILDGVAQGAAILAAIGTYSTAMGVTHYSFGPVKVDLAVDTALARLEGQIRATGGTVVCGPLPEVVGDRERLTDLFRILLSNAFTYRSAPPPKVSINARLDSGEWIFSVRDNGIGIAPKYHGGLFRPFYRLHGSEIPGVGLGLATTQKILEAHKGRIWIESDLGAGATFYFTLPA